MICTEHVYKNSPQAYRHMVKSRPVDIRTQLFPGAEAITEEGVDIIVFAEEDWYDHHPLLLRPFSLSLENMIQYLNDSDLHYFIPHPRLTHNPLRSLFDSTVELDSFLSSVASWEVHNGCYLAFEKLWETPIIGSLTKRWMGSLCESAHAPVTRTRRQRSFLAVGSDAHHPEELGTCVHIVCNIPVRRSDIFQALVTNTDLSVVDLPLPSRPLLRLLRVAWTTFTEWWIKQEYRRYDYHHTSFNPHQYAMTFTSR